MLDFVNIIYVLIILLVINKYYSIKKLYLFLMFLHLPMIFLFNGFLFSPEYMPDQFQYVEVAKNIRNLDFFNEFNFFVGRTVLVAGIIFAVFPIPFIDSIYSIAIINYLLYLVVFLFMYKKGFSQSKLTVYFYLFFPSILLYHSVALRDILIFTIMFFGLYFLIFKRKVIFSFVIMSSLIFLKFQNLLIISTGFIGSILLSKKISKKILLIGMVAFLGVYIIFSEYFSIDKLNFYRWAFYQENIPNTYEPFSSLNSYFELILYALPSALKLFFRPLPWQEFGLFQIVQFFENLVLSCIIIYIWIQNSKLKIWKLTEIKLINFISLTSLVVYGLVLFNSGTAVRYKFPFVTIYIIYSLYFIYNCKKSKLFSERVEA